MAGGQDHGARLRASTAASGDGRRSSAELGTKLFEMKSDYAVKQIRHLLSAPASAQ